MFGKATVPVAVKRLKHGASLIDQSNFLREACTMAQFDDDNIVQLKGVVTKSKLNEKRSNDNEHDKHDYNTDEKLLTIVR